MTKTTKVHKTSMNRRMEKKAAQSRRRLWGWIAGGVIVVVLAGYGVALVWAEQANIPGVQTFGDLSRQHTTGSVQYPQNPPVGGDHNSVWLNCGIYDQPVPNENAVHSLEHGAVWITYQPNLPASAVEQLRQLVRGKQFVILSPYDNLPAPVVASAWSTQLLLNGADDPRLPRFLKKYVQGPQTPELGAECTGGTGNPLP